MSKPLWVRSLIQTLGVIAVIATIIASGFGVYALGYYVYTSHPIVFLWSIVFLVVVSIFLAMWNTIHRDMWEREHWRTEMESHKEDEE